jgi:molybdate transport repressor ModE-like protein
MNSHLEYINALAAFARAGTMARAALKLRLSQSAVSKHIAALEAIVGASLIERHGRNAVLTPAGRRLLERTEPLLTALQDALSLELDDTSASVSLTIGVAESVLASWGAAYLRRAVASVSGLSVDIHAHRSPVVTDRVSTGHYALGIVAGVVDLGRGLIEERLGDEPMVLIPSGLNNIARPSTARPVGVITIEERSGTWAALARRAKQAGIVPERRVETFFSAASMALAGYGHAFVPAGVTEALKVPVKRLVTWQDGKLSRPIAVVTRPAARERQKVNALIAALTQQFDT